MKLIERSGRRLVIGVESTRPPTTDLGACQDSQPCIVVIRRYWYDIGSTPVLLFLKMNVLGDKLYVGICVKEM